MSYPQESGKLVLLRKFYDVEELIRTVEQDIVTTRVVLASADKLMIKPLSSFEHSHHD
jgi:hypothetical protein